MKIVTFTLWILFPVMLMSQGKIIAHRGASSIAPENTIAAFAKAIELGVGFIEVDLRFSEEDSIMVIHDETLDRTTNGSGNVNQFTYHHLRELSAGYSDKFGSDFINEKIPTLFEVLMLTKAKVNVCIDVKNTPEVPIIEQIEQMDMIDEVFLMSYNIEKLKRIKDVNSNIRTIFIKNTLTSIDIETAKENGVFGVSTSYISPLYLVGKAHDKNLELWMGIVSDPSKAESLLGQNVDAILTNHPQLMTMDTEEQIVVFPNPFFKEIKISLLNTENVQSVFIVNTKGEFVQEFKKPFPSPLIWKPGINNRKGLYLVYVISNERIIFEKILFL
jgi:glycerophosphoryl diester phosphodiesterase